MTPSLQRFCADALLLYDNGEALHASSSLSPSQASQDAVPVLQEADYTPWKTVRLRLDLSLWQPGQSEECYQALDVLSLQPIARSAL